MAGLRQGGSQKYPWPRQLGAMLQQRRTRRQQPLLLPVPVSSGSESLGVGGGGITKRNNYVAVCSKTSCVVNFKVQTHIRIYSILSSCSLEHRTFSKYNIKRGKKIDL